MNIFTIDRLLELFWLGVQQICFVLVKRAYNDILNGNKGCVALCARQTAVFAAFAIFAFLPELGLHFMERLFTAQGAAYFAWTVRITLCTAMMLFDALLVLYCVRIIRIYRGGVNAAGTALPWDAILTSAAVLLASGYVCASIHASERFRFSTEQYLRVGRFFVETANFTYIILEGAAAAMVCRLFLWLRKREKNV